MRVVALVKAQIPNGTTEKVHAAHDALFTEQNVAGFQAAGNLSHRALVREDAQGSVFMGIDVWEAPDEQAVLGFYKSAEFQAAIDSVGTEEPEVTVYEDRLWARFGDGLA